MKIKRGKAYKKILQFYKTNYGFSEPYNVVFDGEFIEKCLNLKLYFKELIPKVLDSKCTFYFTPCAIAELKRKGDEAKEEYNAAKRLEFVNCKHQFGKDDDKLTARCFLDLAKKNGVNRYFFAVQNNDIRYDLRKVPGVPLLFILSNMVILEKPSTNSFTEMISTRKVLTQVSNAEKEALLKLKYGDKYDQFVKEREENKKKQQEKELVKKQKQDELKKEINDKKQQELKQRQQKQQDRKATTTTTTTTTSSTTPTKDLKKDIKDKQKNEKINQNKPKTTTTTTTTKSSTETPAPKIYKKGISLTKDDDHVTFSSSEDESEDYIVSTNNSDSENSKNQFNNSKKRKEMDSDNEDEEEEDEDDNDNSATKKFKSK
ncbi:U3 snoRNP protein [Tieghemostelium lacteum]|uniref:U3 snoRNP protein n=1 Tax=Tieghemostelium lacteum TaxID=361077 RepID=A0A151Z2X7_TIELA|nr:U3 snoRNP protein [Tieghemostelium lacteum]|eukprot:KYQ88301.1 U3 snoRNP protein [Tieghemostelium lacteum]